MPESRGRKRANPLALAVAAGAAGAGIFASSNAAARIPRYVICGNSTQWRAPIPMNRSERNYRRYRGNNSVHGVDIVRQYIQYGTLTGSIAARTTQTDAQRAARVLPAVRRAVCHIINTTKKFIRVRRPYCTARVTTVANSSPRPSSRTPRMGRNECDNITVRRLRGSDSPRKLVIPFISLRAAFNAL